MNVWKTALAVLILAAARAGARSLPAAVVWVPPENFASWSQVDALMRARSGVKLTIALSPEMAKPPIVKAALGPWVSEGRVELAARIPGDPVLPWVASHPAAPRAGDALERAADARAELASIVGAEVAGFVPGAGALDAALARALSAAGLNWALTGPYAAPSSSWTAEGRTVFIPARLSSAPPAGAELAAGGALVLDESFSSETRALAALQGSRESPDGGWATVSELVSLYNDARAPLDEEASWPAWDGQPVSAPSEAAAQAYGEAAKALERYRNSGAADLKLLESAAALLRRAQDSRFFRDAPGSPLPAELRARLLAVYKKLRTSAPESLFEGPSVSTSAAAPGEGPTGVRAAAGPDWISFSNPGSTQSRAPQGAPNGDPWRLRGLRVEWDETRVLFRLYPSRVDAAPPHPRPVYDVYIDLNRVLGAGSIRLLEGRGVYSQARDAWEFALSAGASEAAIWKATRGEPEELAKVKLERDSAAGEIRVSVPRATLRGNPARWGYLALALAEDPGRIDQSPPAVLAGADGTRVLGLLAPLETQKAVFDKPGSPQRVPAARLERK